jgi:predicted transcriptional regulator
VQGSGFEMISKTDIKLLKFMSKHGELSVTTIQKQTKISLTTAISCCKKLTQLGFLNSKVTACLPSKHKMKFYRITEAGKTLVEAFKKTKQREI